MMELNIDKLKMGIQDLCMYPSREEVIALWYLNDREKAFLYEYMWDGRSDLFEDKKMKELCAGLYTDLTLLQLFIREDVI